MKLIWNRPESVAFPKLWCTFKARDINNDEIIEYFIQDLPETRFDEGIEFMAKHFCMDEPICEALGRHLLKKKIINKFQHFESI